MKKVHGMGYIMAANSCLIHPVKLCLVLQGTFKVYDGNGECVLTVLHLHLTVLLTKVLWLSTL